MKVIEYGILDKNKLSYDEKIDITGGAAPCGIDTCGAHACGTDHCTINLCGANACAANLVTVCGIWAWIWAPEDPNHSNPDENSLGQY